VTATVVVSNKIVAIDRRWADASASAGLKYNVAALNANAIHTKEVIFGLRALCQTNMISTMDQLMAKLPVGNNIPTAGKAEIRMSIEIGTYHVDHVVRPLRDASHKTMVSENGK